MAAVALYHFLDCLAVSRNEKLLIIEDQLKIAFPRFQALANIANAAKHFELRRGGLPRRGLAAQHFLIGRGAAFTDGTYFSDGTTFSDAPDVIRIEFRGEIIDVLGLCQAAILAWEKLA